MNSPSSSSLHDAYAAEYDAQVQAYDCHVADLLFGLCYEFTAPGQTLLDLGIGSGLSAALFARAGLRVSGLDFSAAMLELCRAKGFALDLTQHDLHATPWPVPYGYFDHLVCCGVLHFIADLERIFAEAGRVLKPEGYFAFTTRDPNRPLQKGEIAQSETVGDFEIVSHSLTYLDGLLGRNSFTRLKLQKCCVGQDAFHLWVVRKGGNL